MKLYLFENYKRPCLLPAVFYICKSLYITEQPSCLQQSHKRFTVL